jgi:hypothetical protein
MWAAMKGHTKAVEALIVNENGADKDATEKVRRRCCVNEGYGVIDKIMFGTGLRDLGATGCKCPMHCSCGLCNEASCARNVPHARARTAHPWCCRT